jgi:hypothetical protein
LNVKSVFNPLIERISTSLAGVDQYPDIFEKLALARRQRGLIRALGRRRLAPDLAAAPLLFIHVPKNGGTSVKRALYRSDPGHASARYYDLFFPEWFARVPSLAILRDPVDRFLSGFDFLLNGGGGDVAIQARPMRRMAHIKTVDALLDHLETTLPAAGWLGVDTFLRPQSWYVVDVAGVLRVSHFWLLDADGKGLANFLKAYGIDAIPHANRTRRATHALTAAQHARLQALYPEDFALHALVRAASGYLGNLSGVPVSALKAPATSASIAS